MFFDEEKIAAYLRGPQANGCGRILTPPCIFCMENQE
jgi:hypothetical protein